MNDQGILNTFPENCRPAFYPTLPAEASFLKDNVRSWKAGCDSAIQIQAEELPMVSFKQMWKIFDKMFILLLRESSEAIYHQQDRMNLQQCLNTLQCLTLKIEPRIWTCFPFLLCLFNYS